MRHKHVWIVIGCALLAGCASGPKYQEVQAGLSARPDDLARIYFYRTQVFGAGVQPDIFLNGEKVGTCQPKGVFYKDVGPGKYEVGVETEVERKLTFVAAAGEERYVRCHISLGLLVGRGNVELVDPTDALGEIQGLVYTGTD